MERKINYKKLIFFTVITVVCFLTGRFVLGIIIFIFLVNSLKIKNAGKEKNKKSTAAYYNRLPASKTTGKTFDFGKIEEQKQREKWAKRRDKDPWEWDE